MFDQNCVDTTYRYVIDIHYRHAIGLVFVDIAKVHHRHAIDVRWICQRNALPYTSIHKNRGRSRALGGRAQQKKHIYIYIYLEGRSLWGGVPRQRGGEQKKAKKKRIFYCYYCSIFFLLFFSFPPGPLATISNSCRGRPSTAPDRGEVSKKKRKKNIYIYKYFSFFFLSLS